MLKRFTSTLAVSRSLLTAMPSNQKEFLRLLGSHGYQIYLHLLKIHCYPNNDSVNHWKAEVKNHFTILIRHRKSFKVNLDNFELEGDLRSKFNTRKEWERIHYLGKPELTRREANHVLMLTMFHTENLLSQDSLSYQDLTPIFPKEP